PSTASVCPCTVTPAAACSACSGVDNPTAAHVDPSAKPGSSSAPHCASAATSTAEASIVDRAGPGCAARPNASIATASSSNPAPCPPYCSGMCSPRRPCSAKSGQNGGIDSVSRSISVRNTSAVI